ERLANHALGQALGLLWRLGELDEPRLAPSARMDLRFDDDPSQLLGNVGSLGRSLDHLASGDGNAVLLKDLLRLELVEFQCTSSWMHRGWRRLRPAAPLARRLVARHAPCCRQGSTAP